MGRWFCIVRHKVASRPLLCATGRHVRPPSGRAPFFVRDSDLSLVQVRNALRVELRAALLTGRDKTSFAEEHLGRV
jgi:hypothetical protein